MNKIRYYKKSKENMTTNANKLKKKDWLDELSRQTEDYHQKIF